MTKNDIVKRIDIAVDSVLVDNYKKLTTEEFMKYLDSQIYYLEDELVFHVKLDRIKTDLMTGTQELTRELIVEVEELITDLSTIQQRKYKELHEYKNWLL